MGVPSNDVDFAVDNMSGVEFAALLKQNATVDCAYKVIKANPEQHKFIETATINILNLQIEVISLRPSTYASDASQQVSYFSSRKFLKIS